MAVALDAVCVRVKGVCKQNGLLILSVLAVIIGCLLGFFLRTKQLSEQVSVNLLCLNTTPKTTVLIPTQPYLPHHSVTSLKSYLPLKTYSSKYRLNFPVQS